MSQTRPSVAHSQTDGRLGTTTMSRRRGDIVISIEGVPTYQSGEDSEVMIPGPLAVKLDDAMLTMLEEIERSSAEMAAKHAIG